MLYKALKAGVGNRGNLRDLFLDEMVRWFKTAPDEIFAQNANYDIYNKVYTELGPYLDRPLYRRAVMFEVVRVLALFESSGDWNEGVDLSRDSTTTNENAEAGAWQVSWNNRKLDPSLNGLLILHDVRDGREFQKRMKQDHELAMEFICRLLRIDVKDYARINNGPVRKVNGYGGLNERKLTWPHESRHWPADQSIYPWLRRDAVEEAQTLLA